MRKTTTMLTNNKSKLSAISLLFIYMLLNTCPIKAQTAPTIIADSLQAILDEALPTSPANSGAVMGVFVPGKWSWYGASGHAIAGITPGQSATFATPTTQFRVGSITKTMVATCILKLEQQGLLSINDPINLYLRPTLVNDTINASDTIYIRQLLNHTSGIANSADNNTCRLAVLNNPLAGFSLEESIYCGASQGELFAPGTNWYYSNTNYTILALIIQNITGLSCADYIRQNIIMPLGLTQTEIPTTNQITNPHMGCYWNIGTWLDLTIINPTVYTGWADVVSTTNDLITFYTALLNGQLIDSTELAQMRTIDAASFDYGMGLDFYTILGTDYYGHYGEVANTSGLFFADVHSPTAPDGYYIAYNFNTQGIDLSTIDGPVFQLLDSAISGIKSATLTAKTTLYPNPASNGCTVVFTDAHQGLTLSITDILGRPLLTQAVSAATKQVFIDTQNWAKGIYWVTFEGESTSYTQKLVLQ